MRSTVKGQSLAGVTNLALMAPVHERMVPGEESIAYVERLRRLLDALHASRRNQREAELDGSVFPDPIGRFDIIQQFRYAIWTPPAGASGPRHYLTLNVSFDGGWEPYMRVIQRDIGPLLDALLCHCPGYPGSRQATFDAYCRWVREHEMDAGIFYTEGSATAADARYLAAIERFQREQPDATAAQGEVADFAMPSLAELQRRAMAKVMADPARALALPLRTLKGLYRLVPFFGRDGLTLAREDLVLQRFARLVLREFHGLAMKVLAQPPDPQFAALALKLAPIVAEFRDELEWLCTEDPAPTPPVPGTSPAQPYDPGLLQDSILNRTAPVTHGCLMLLRVDDAQAARQRLADWQAFVGQPAGAAAMHWHIGFTHAGLAALGASAGTLDALAPEFAQGMEARCGILGDLRGNHPDRWRRPLRFGSPNGHDDRIDLGNVHAVLVLRKEDARTASVALHPEFAALAQQIAAPGSGWQVLAVEATRSRRDEAGQPLPGFFGFADGISQPVFTDKPPGQRGRDEVAAGELVLGHSNDRGDLPWSMHRDDPLLCDGSFLVVRKLRQRVDRLDDARLSLEARAKMMGRWQDGRPLLDPALPAEPGANAFDYEKDPHGRHCPFQSHARRTNPRDGRPHMPRILRRGMSYGPSPDEGPPDADRGVMFMAYCASIAEQFEVLQSWIAGGNSSGLSSAQSDPFLGVPRPEEDRVFRYIDAQGTLQHAKLGPERLVELQWGLYLFVPSRAGLRALAGEVAPAVSARTAGSAPAWDPAGDLEQWRLRLEVPEHSPQEWAAVRAQPGGCAHANGYGELVGGLAAVQAVLQDKGYAYSVQGYAGRMAPSIGVNLLGMDATDPAREPQAKAVNGAIDEVKEAQAFEVAWGIVLSTLAEFHLFERPPNLPPGDPQVQRPIDLVTLGERVLARLCTHWFGLPDGATMVIGGRRPNPPAPGSIATPRCPGDLFSSSRTIFAPHPPSAVMERAAVEGPAVLDAVRAKLRSGAPLGPLSRDIRAALAKQPGISPDELQDIFERNIAGMLLGFPPTVQGNFLQVMKTWIEKGELWQQQQAVADGLRQLHPASATAAQVYDAVTPKLRPRLMATMRQRPVPEVLWRSPVDSKGGVDTRNPDQRVIVGIRSALAEVEADPATQRGDYDELMFGGSRQAGPLHGEHACPGYQLGVGVLLALMIGLLSAGTLRPTGSPVQLMLTPRPPPLPQASAS